MKDKDKKKLNEGRTKKPTENTMGYTIPDTDKLLKFIEQKFTKDLKPLKQKLKESVIKLIEK